MGAYISMSSEVGGRALIGAWALKGINTVTGSLRGCCNHFENLGHKDSATVLQPFRVLKPIGQLLISHSVWSVSIC